MHKAAMESLKLFVEKYLKDRSGLVLDVGSYNVNGSCKEAFDDELWEYTGIDVRPGEGVDVVCDEHKFPLLSSHFDVVTASSVLEHDPAFWLTFAEMVRVTKQHGLIYVQVPSEGGYHGHPKDYWRFQKDCWEALHEMCWEARVIESYFNQNQSWYDNIGIFRVDRS